MPNRKHHTEVGFWTGAVLGGLNYLLDPSKRQNANLLDLAIHATAGGIGGSFAAQVPDELEPAIHSHHRGAAHSIATMAGVATVTFKGLVNESANSIGNSMAIGAGGGYLMHLLDDAKTPRGLPWITRGL